MGNQNCSDDINCLICLENINTKKKVTCIKCNIELHINCEEKFRAENGYCKCPHCQQIGTLGINKKYFLLEK